MVGGALAKEDDAKVDDAAKRIAGSRIAAWLGRVESVGPQPHTDVNPDFHQDHSQDLGQSLDGGRGHPTAMRTKPRFRMRRESARKQTFVRRRLGLSPGVRDR